MYTGCHYSAPYYYFEHNFSYSAQQIYNYYYTRFLIMFDVFVSNRTPGPTATPVPLSGMFVFKRDGWPWTYETVRTEYFSYQLFQYNISTNTPLNLNPQEWVFVKTVTNIRTYTNDGFERLGAWMNIDWIIGDTQEDDVKKGLEWACNSKMNFKTTALYPWVWFAGIANSSTKCN